MDEEQIFSTLSERLGETSFSERTIRGYIELNPIAEGETPDDAYYEKAVKWLKTMQGQYNHDIAEFKKSLTPQPLKPNNEPTPPKGGDDSKKEIDELKKTLDALQSKITESEQKEVQKQLISKVKAAMRASKATDEYVLEKTLQGKTLDTNKSVEDNATEMLKAYDAEYKACRGTGATPRAGNGSGGGTDTSSAVNRYFAQKAKKEGWAKK